MPKKIKLTPSENAINNLVIICLQKSKTNFERIELENIDLLIELGVILEDSSNINQVFTNLKSVKFNECLLNYYKSRANYIHPTSISDITEIIDQFETLIKKEFNENQNLTSRKILEGLYGFLLGRLKSSGFDVYSYAFERIKSDKSDRFLDYFDNGFIYHLTSSDYSLEQVYCLCQISTQTENSFIYRKLIQEVFKQPNDLAYKLYKFGTTQEEYEQSEFQIRIILKLYNTHTEEIFKKIIELLAQNSNIGIRLLAFCELKKEHIREAIDTASNYIDESFLNEQINNLLYNIAGSNKASSIQREQAYDLWMRFLDNSETGFSLQIIHLVRLIGREEDEAYRFNMLMSYLNKTKNFSIVNSFFSQFKDPNFLYKLLSDLYQKTPGRKLSLTRSFSNPIKHFFRSNPEETENCILKQFNPIYNLKTLPVDIIMIGHSSVFHIDLLKLSTEEIQLAAIQKICLTTINFDKILPILIVLRKSPFLKVRESLKGHLSILAHEVYGIKLIEWIKVIIGKEKNVHSFLKPIKHAAELHEKFRIKKFEINDLNPYYQEKKLMEYYFALSHENQTKLMQESRNDPSFLTSHFKNSSIVRGNSFRHGNSESEVIPLGSVSASTLIDSRIYKNPDLLEFQLNNIL
ncbi:hypothetical protein ERX46_01650 [Brumimicrobium glaciale]|uniref:Uncharacterized protein n=1 Tax=Brumimicrobium glaciale TaxID=200475 RepID=A0A4Q4KUC2_9FLAO|nr:hypothetical protein [Brumimicrobium glaciale]RYM35724.1 hypothetical protein ERX46_01650 [Brumimicrobium glaciale]